jgi:hypothetical protein
MPNFLAVQKNGCDTLCNVTRQNLLRKTAAYFPHIPVDSPLKYYCREVGIFGSKNISLDIFYDGTSLIFKMLDAFDMKV